MSESTAEDDVTGVDTPEPPVDPKPAGETGEEVGHEGTVTKSRVGVVVSNSMDKTIVVKVTRRVPHPRFKKIVKRSTKFFAHDEKGEAVVGDKVLIEETRPRSKRKCWELKEVLSH